MAGISKEPIVLSQEEKEFIDGALLGDGHITKPRGRSCQFSYVTSKRTHAEYVYQKLKRLAVGECLNGPTKSLVFDKRTNKTYTSYKFRSVSNITFFELRTRWYPDGNKVIPNDVVLSPITTLIWYLGDGGLGKANRTSYIKLSTHGFQINNIKNILFPQMSIYEPSLIQEAENQWWVYIPRRNIDKFLKFIGDCPVSEYEYKWTPMPYKYKSVELYGVSDYSSIYPSIIEEWKIGCCTIYELSKKYKVPIRCIKDEFSRKNINWTPINTKKKIGQYDVLDKRVKIWDSGQDIKRELGYNASAISDCCRGIRKLYRGYIWKFEQIETH